MGTLKRPQNPTAISDLKTNKKKKKQLIMIEIFIFGPNAPKAL